MRNCTVVTGASGKAAAICAKIGEMPFVPSYTKDMVSIANLRDV